MHLTVDTLDNTLQLEYFSNSTFVNETLIWGEPTRAGFYFGFLNPPPYSTLPEIPCIFLHSPIGGRAILKK